MHEIKLSLIIEEGHPAYEWAKNQSDAVGAFGHLGTHIDCYQSTPEKTHYEVDTLIIDCTKEMPSVKEIEALNISGKALILFTGNMEKNGYGTPEYGAMNTHLKSNALDAILLKSPAFIIIDSYGIGAHGEEHIKFDRRCESKDCFVIENVAVSHIFPGSCQKLNISIDTSSGSTGKRCLVTAISAKHPATPPL